MFLILGVMAAPAAGVLVKVIVPPVELAWSGRAMTVGAHTALVPAGIGLAVAVAVRGRQDRMRLFKPAVMAVRV